MTMTITRLREDLPPLLTYEQVAELLQLSLWAVKARARRAQLPLIRLGGTTRVPRDELLQMLDEHHTPPAA